MYVDVFCANSVEIKISFYLDKTRHKQKHSGKYNKVGRF